MRFAVVLASTLVLATMAQAQEVTWPSEQQFLRGEAISCRDVPIPEGVFSKKGFDQPLWPFRSQRLEEEGAVRVGVCVSRIGAPRSVRLLHPSDETEEFSKSRRLQRALAAEVCSKRHTPSLDDQGQPAESCDLVVEYAWRKENYPRWEPNPMEAAATFNTSGR
jgi:hypothetical protein